MHKIITWVVLLGWFPLAQADVLKVGFENLEYSPYYTPAGGGQTEGVAVQILQKFAADNGHTLVIEALPVARLLPSFLSGAVDFKFPDNAYWASDAKAGKNVQYSAPVLPSTDGVLVVPDKAGKTNLKTLGVVRGFSPWVYMDAVKANELSLKETSNLDSLIKQAVAGRVDGAYANVAVVSNSLGQMGMANQLVFDASLPHSAASFSLSTITKTDVLNQFNEFLKINSDWIAQLIANNGIQ
jgi:hypothetical protein